MNMKVFFTVLRPNIISHAVDIPHCNRQSRQIFSKNGGFQSNHHVNLYPRKILGLGIFQRSSKRTAKTHTLPTEPGCYKRDGSALKRAGVFSSNF